MSSIADNTSEFCGLADDEVEVAVLGSKVVPMLEGRLFDGLVAGLWGLVAGVGATLVAETLLLEGVVVAATGTAFGLAGGGPPLEMSFSIG